LFPRRKGIYNSPVPFASSSASFSTLVCLQGHAAFLCPVSRSTDSTRPIGGHEVYGPWSGHSSHGQASNLAGARGSIFSHVLITPYPRNLGGVLQDSKAQQNFMLSTLYLVPNWALHVMHVHLSATHKVDFTYLPALTANKGLFKSQHV
jgi:hypothetical protein